MRKLPKKGFGLTLAAIIAALFLTGCVADFVDRYSNDLQAPSNPADQLLLEPRLTDEEGAFLNSLFIVDLHADTMLWDRNFLEKSDFGHVDLKRLKEGNVALQY